MPELPEVETIVRELNVVVAGKIIKDIDFLLEKIARPNPVRVVELVRGALVEYVERIGKFIVFRLAEGPRMVVHLKMTGKFLLGKGTENNRPPKHVHAVLTMNNGTVFVVRGYPAVRLFDGIVVNRV